MPNPGSPEQIRAMQAAQPPPMMPKNTMIGMMFTMVILLVVTQFREQIGKALDVVFRFIDMGGEEPVLTLVICGVIMITLSTVIRSFFIDPVKQARNQHINREFQSEMKQARLDNNLYKLKKLQEEQPRMLEASMSQNTDMMKIMPVTMIIIIPIYAWVYYFVTNTVADAGNLVIDMPWGTADLKDNVWIMPVWIVIYTLISLPLGQLENKLMQHWRLGKRLEEVNREYV